MSSRSGGADAPLSLFSFQDVITSITGIMILVVLLLVLEVIHSKTSEPLKEIPTDVESRIASLQREKDRLDRKIKEIQGDVERLGGMNPEQVAADIKREKNRAAVLGGKKEECGDAIEQTHGDIRKIGEDIARLEQEKERLRRELEDLIKQLAEAKRVRLECRCSKQHILVQCSGKGIKAQPLDGRGEVLSFIPAGGTDRLASLRKFREWALKRDKGDVHFIAVVKPSAAPYAGQVVDTLRRDGFAVGYEPLEEDKTVISESQGSP